MTDKKIKILTLGDHPLVSSGVGTQSRYVFEGLLRTGKYMIRSLGGAIRHNDYSPQKISEFDDDWIIFPVNGYGDENVVRQILDAEKPDIVWVMTDPRFYGWLANMSDEIRDRGIPLVYWHVWDNYPVPKFNTDFYSSFDHIACISKLTHDILKQLGFKDKSSYLPHAVDINVFKPFIKEEILKHKEIAFGSNKDKFVVFYNSRNARRKMTSDVIKIFKLFLDKVGHDKAFLLMHCDPFDQEGANLIAVAEMLRLTNEQIAFSRERVPPEQMAIFYNTADTTINISNAEGFGLSCLESLSCGTPAVVNKTGGLQDQIIDDEGNIFGVLIEPAVQSLVGSQSIPHIYEDRSTDQSVVDGLTKIFKMNIDERIELGLKAHEWTKKAFNMKNMISSWDKILTETVENFKCGYPERIRIDKI